MKLKFVSLCNLQTCSFHLYLNMCNHKILLLLWISHNRYFYPKTEYIHCGATLINLQYAVCALHCFRAFATDFEKIKETAGLPSSTKPLDLLIVVAGAYYARKYQPNSEPEYEFQVSITFNDTIQHKNCITYIKISFIDDISTFSTNKPCTVCAPL